MPQSLAKVNVHIVFTTKYGQQFITDETSTRTSFLHYWCFCQSYIPIRTNYMQIQITFIFFVLYRGQSQWPIWLLK